MATTPQYGPIAPKKETANLGAPTIQGPSTIKVPSESVMTLTPGLFDLNAPNTKTLGGSTMPETKKLPIPQGKVGKDLENEKTDKLVKQYEAAKDKSAFKRTLSNFEISLIENSKVSKEFEETPATTPSKKTSTLAPIQGKTVLTTPKIAAEDAARAKAAEQYGKEPQRTMGGTTSQIQTRLADLKAEELSVRTGEIESAKAAAIKAEKGLSEKEKEKLNVERRFLGTDTSKTAIDSFLESAIDAASFGVIDQAKKLFGIDDGILARAEKEGEETGTYSKPISETLGAFAGMAAGYAGLTKLAFGTLSKIPMLERARVNSPIIYDIAVNGPTVSVIEAGIRKGTGQEYSVNDFVVDVGFNSLFAGAFNIPQFFKDSVKNPLKNIREGEVRKIEANWELTVKKNPKATNEDLFNSIKDIKLADGKTFNDVYVDLKKMEISGEDFFSTVKLSELGRTKNSVGGSVGKEDMEKYLKKNSVIGTTDSENYRASIMIDELNRKADDINSAEARKEFLDFTKGATVSDQSMDDKLREISSKYDVKIDDRVNPSMHVDNLRDTNVTPVKSLEGFNKDKYTDAKLLKKELTDRPAQVGDVARIESTATKYGVPVSKEKLVDANGEINLAEVSRVLNDISLRANGFGGAMNKTYKAINTQVNETVDFLSSVKKARIVDEAGNARTFTPSEAKTLMLDELRAAKNSIQVEMRKMMEDVKKMQGFDKSVTVRNAISEMKRRQEIAKMNIVAKYNEKEYLRNSFKKGVTSFFRHNMTDIPKARQDAIVRSILARTQEVDNTTRFKAAMDDFYAKVEAEDTKELRKQVKGLLEKYEERAYGDPKSSVAADYLRNLSKFEELNSEYIQNGNKDSLREIRNSIEEIIRTGKDRYMEHQRFMKEQNLTDMGDILSDGGAKRLNRYDVDSFASQGDKKVMESVLNGARGLQTIDRTMENIFGKNTKGFDIFYRNIGLKADTEYLLELREVADGIFKRLDKGLSRTRGFFSNKGEVTPKEFGVYLKSKRENSFQKIMESENNYVEIKTGEFADESSKDFFVNGKLNAGKYRKMNYEDLAFIEAKIRANPELLELEKDIFRWTSDIHPRIADLLKKYDNVTLGKVENYLPDLVYGKNQTVDDVMGDMGNINKQLNKDFAHTAHDKVNGPYFIETDIFKVLDSITKHHLYYIHFKDPLTRANRALQLLKHPQKAMDDFTFVKKEPDEFGGWDEQLEGTVNSNDPKIGKVSTEVVQEYINFMNRGGRKIVSKEQAGGAWERLLTQWAPNVTTRLALSFRLPTIAKQFLSFPDLAARYGTKAAVNGLIDVITGEAKFAKEVSGKLSHRMSGEAAIEDALRKRGKNAFEKFTDIGLTPLKYADGINSQIAWATAKRQSLIERGLWNKNSKLSDFADHEASNLDADLGMGRIMASTRPSEMPPAFRNVYMKSLFTLMNTALNQPQIYTHDISYLKGGRYGLNALNAAAYLSVGVALEQSINLLYKRLQEEIGSTEKSAETKELWDASFGRVFETPEYETDWKKVIDYFAVQGLVKKVPVPFVTGRYPLNELAVDAKDSFKKIVSAFGVKNWDDDDFFQNASLISAGELLKMVSPGSLAEAPKALIQKTKENKEFSEGGFQDKETFEAVKEGKLMTSIMKGREKNDFEAAMKKVEDNGLDDISPLLDFTDKYKKSAEETEEIVTKAFTEKVTDDLSKGKDKFIKNVSAKDYAEIVWNIEKEKFGGIAAEDRLLDRISSGLISEEKSVEIYEKLIENGEIEL